MTTLNVDVGKGLSFSIDSDAIAKHQNVMDHVMMIGLRNILMDCHAGVKRDDFDDEISWRNAAKQKSEAKLSAMLAGEIRLGGFGRVHVDSFTNAMRKFVLATFPRDERKAMADSPDKGVARVDARFAKNEAKLRPLIEAKLAAEREAAQAMAAIAGDLEM
jgi:hypothetical protein